MKKRIRTSPSNPYYSTEPAVANSLIAKKPPVQSASLGNQPPKMVDRHPGRISGMAGFEDKKRPPVKKPPSVAGKRPAPGKQIGHIKSPAVKPSKFGALKKMKGL